MVILYRDTDSTLAAVLACRKLNVPISYMYGQGQGPFQREPRGNKPINRVLVDHISEVCFCSDRLSIENLRKEGITENILFSGDIMYDRFLQMKGLWRDNLLQKYGLQKDNYVLMTWHRQENTDTKERMEKILNFFKKIDCKILYPIHPRTRKMLETFGLWGQTKAMENLILIEPVGYKEMVGLQSNVKIILTDSGGLSKESVFAGVKCLLMLDLKIWPDLERISWLHHINFENEENMQ